MAEPPKGYAPSGLLHGHRVTYSQETQNLINTMMNESRLTNQQRKELSNIIKDGKSLPKPSQKMDNSLKSASAPTCRRTVSGQIVLNPRNYSSKMRNKDQIEASGAYERERYHPAPLTKFGGRYDKDKEKLVNIMAYGDERGPAGSMTSKQQHCESPPPEAPPVDRFTEIQNEISEREKFLKEMNSLGSGSKYRHIIETEISLLVREMELIDRRENEELERRIKDKQRIQSQ